MTEPTTHTLDVPGAVLTYDVRRSDSSNAPVLLLIGSPMGAAGFGTLAGHFTDRTVVTYDPRGVERSERTDGATESTPEEHADDVHRLISTLNAGPVDIFASSGGAVVALILTAGDPEQVRTLVAHEPPAAYLLPDAEQALGALDHIRKTYQREGFGSAMAKFMVLSGLKGPIPADFSELPAPPPAQFGLPAEDDGSRDDPLFGEDNRSTSYEHDFGVLRAVTTRIVIGAGAESKGELAHRAALEVAEKLGTKAVVFPSHHGGFLGGESGWRGEPDAFAVTLREILEDR